MASSSPGGETEGRPRGRQVRIVTANAPAAGRPAGAGKRRPRPKDVFDICHARYRAIRRTVGRQIANAKPEGPGAEGYRWRPDRTRAGEYLADFELAGRRALERPMWRDRQRLFEIYFLLGVEYRKALRRVGVPEGTFDYWCGQIKREVGKELERSGLFPPGDYFLKHDERIEEMRALDGAVRRARKR